MLCLNTKPPKHACNKKFFSTFLKFCKEFKKCSQLIKEIKKLNLKKAVQDLDIPIRLLKENADLFANYVYLQFNEGVDSSKFADFLRSGYILSAFEQGSTK